MMKVFFLQLLFVLPSLTQSFQSNIDLKHTFSPKVSTLKRWNSAEVANTVNEESATDSPKENLLSRDRYIASNRFTVRPGKGPKFEKRWATRKSRLSSLDGFRYFHLMRRVSLEDEPDTGTDPLAESGDTFGNYVSFTIWQEKKHFNAWRKGEAFKEAHGGTSIKAFLGTMIKSAMLLKGPPRPAFYDGLLQQSMAPDYIPETVDGWRNIESDTLGKEILPSECLVACNQFFVSPENAKEFELRWAGRESTLKECEGFISFGLLRRDAKAKGHGVAPLGEDEPTYMSTTNWKDRGSFQKWREGSAFQKAHGASGDKGDEEKKEPRKPLWSKPPSPIFYEGTLVITNEEGA